MHIDVRVLGEDGEAHDLHIHEIIEEHLGDLHIDPEAISGAIELHVADGIAIAEDAFAEMEVLMAEDAFADMKVRIADDAFAELEFHAADEADVFAEAPKVKKRIAGVPGQKIRIAAPPAAGKISAGVSADHDVDARFAEINKRLDKIEAMLRKLMERSNRYE